MEGKNVRISGELHAFLKRKASEPENIKNKVGISDLTEKAIRLYFGVNEKGESILKYKKNSLKVEVGDE